VKVLKNYKISKIERKKKKGYELEKLPSLPLKKEDRSLLEPEGLT